MVSITTCPYYSVGHKASCIVEIIEKCGGNNSSDLLSSHKCKKINVKN